MLKKIMFHVKHFLSNQRGEIMTSGMPQATLSEIPDKPKDAPAEPASPAAPVNTTGMSADQLKEKLTGQKVEHKVKPGLRIPVPDDPKPVVKEEKPVEKPQEQAKPTEPAAAPWYKTLGFEDEATALKSAQAAQEKIRQQAEEVKALKTQEQSRVQTELARLREIEHERNLSPQEKQQMAAFEQWEKENSDALKLIEKRLLGKLEQEYDIKPKAQLFEEKAIDSRKQWKQDFDKDKNRAELWPVMDAIYKEKDVFEDFSMNPLPYIEAVAFQKNFPKIAERIRAEAVEQYKAEVKKAEEAAKQTKTEIPGGLKSAGGDVDVSKMSSRDIASLLPRSENG